MEQLKRKTQPLVGKGYMLPFILVTSLFFLWGFARAILDVLNKHFQTSLNISITESALIQVTTYLGYFLMAIPAGAFINKYGYRGGVVFGLILYAIGAFLFIPVSSIGTHTLWHCLSLPVVWLFWKHRLTLIPRNLVHRKLPHPV